MTVEESASAYGCLFVDKWATCLGCKPAFTKTLAAPATLKAGEDDFKVELQIKFHIKASNTLMIFCNYRPALLKKHISIKLSEDKFSADCTDTLGQQGWFQRAKTAGNQIMTRGQEKPD